MLQKITKKEYLDKLDGRVFYQGGYAIDILTADRCTNGIVDESPYLRIKNKYTFKKRSKDAVLEPDPLAVMNEKVYENFNKNDVYYKKQLNYGTLLFHDYAGFNNVSVKYLPDEQ